MTPQLTAVAALTTALALAAHGPAAGAPTGPPLRGGIFGGFHATSDDIDVLGARVPAAQADAGGLIGLRVGWRATRWFDLELSASVVPAPTRGTDETAVLAPLHADITVRFLRGMVQPYAALGGGAFFLATQGGDADLLLHGAIGVGFVIDQRVEIRLQAGVYATDGVEAFMSFNPVVTVGVDLLGWRDAEVDEPPTTPRTPVLDRDATASPDDRDGDGIANEDDACPDHRGPRHLDGCPDSDGDGIIDAFDRCPLEAGHARLEGCRDSDGDGVPDVDDACVDAPGAHAHHGCAPPG